jgi:hypothetical protein
LVNEACAPISDNTSAAVLLVKVSEPDNVTKSPCPLLTFVTRTAPFTVRELPSNVKLEFTFAFGAPNAARVIIPSIVVPVSESIPDVPPLPAVPDVPPVPEVPPLPAVPRVPDVPDVPPLPAVPRVPDVPDVPPVPDVPKHAPFSVIVPLPVSKTTLPPRKQAVRVPIISKLSSVTPSQLFAANDAPPLSTNV